MVVTCKTAEYQTNEIYNHSKCDKHNRQYFICINFIIESF